MTNSAEYIAQHGNSEDYEPSPAVEPCGYPAGSLGRLEAMQRRAELGQSLWHPQDNQAMASPAESEAMSIEVLRIAREGKYANRAGS
jgi:hypothetical protein